MIDIMYTDATLKIKVNSHVAKGFHPTNGVAKGNPISPILYLLVIQRFISLLNISPEVEGISVPGPGGDESNCCFLKARALADDRKSFPAQHPPTQHFPRTVGHIQKRIRRRQLMN